MQRVIRQVAGSVKHGRAHLEPGHQRTERGGPGDTGQGLVKGGEGLVGSWPMDANLTRR